MAQVYFNLHKRSWSIRVRGRVINKHQQTTLVVLRDVTFRVSEAGRQRVIAEQRKNVHAFAVGTVDEGPFPLIFPDATVPVSYNPYKAGHFVRKDTGEAVHACKLLVMTTREVDGKRVPVVLAQI